MAISLIPPLSEKSAQDLVYNAYYSEMNRLNLQKIEREIFLMKVSLFPDVCYLTNLVLINHLEKHGFTISSINTFMDALTDVDILDITRNAVSHRSTVTPITHVWLIANAVFAHCNNQQ